MARRRSAGFFLALVVGLSACATAQQGGASADPAPDEADADASLTFTPEADAAAAVTVTLEEGGTVSATGSDGTTFELVVPPEAVPGDTEITITPLSDVRGIGADAAHAVLLEPSGTEFYELLRLTITPGEPIPLEDQLMFEAAGDGANPELALIDPESDDIVILLDHFSVAGIATASEAQRARMLEKSAANAEARLNSLVRARINGERNQELTTGEESSNVPRDSLDAIAEEFQREVLDKRKAAAEESCRATKEYVRSVIRWERQLQIAGMTEAEEAASLERILAADQYAQSRKQECEDEAIAACKKAEDPQILIDFWLWIGDSVNRERAEKTCLPQGIALTVERTDMPLPAWADSDGTLDLTALVLGCRNEDGTWTFKGAVRTTNDHGSEDYPGAISGPQEPEDDRLVEPTSGQMPESFRLALGSTDEESVIIVTDGLGAQPTAVFHWVDRFGDPVGDFPLTVTKVDPQCPLPEL